MATLAATVFAIVVVGSDGLQPALLVALPGVILMGKLLGLYDRDELVVHKTTVDEAPRFFVLATFYTLGFWFLDGMFVDGRLGKLEAFALCASLWVFGLVGRWVTRHLVHLAVPAERCVFAGDATTHDRLEQKLAVNGIRSALVGRLSLESVASSRDGRWRLDETAFRDRLRELDAHRLVIAASPTEPAITLDLVRAAKALGVRVSLVPNFLDVVGSSVVFDDLGGMTLLGIRRSGLSRSSFALKRTFDLAIAGLLLLATAPFSALAAMAIRLDSPGPILFRQVRVGREGRLFRMLKFRTMAVDAEARKEALRPLSKADGRFKIADDPRVTRVGRRLRRSSLDELPQLINVLRGEMSLVGPRPLVLDEDRAITGYDRSRLHLTPGMTGQWQILGSTHVPLAEMVKIDYLYVAGWSLWVDVKIILRTVLFVLGQRGA